MGTVTETAWYRMGAVFVFMSIFSAFTTQMVYFAMVWFGLGIFSGGVGSIIEAIERAGKP